MEISAVKSYIAGQREFMIRDLAGFVRILSITENRNEVRQALRYILNLARDMGFSAKSVLDEQVGVIELGDGDETVGILAHVDVVPPGNLAAWQTPPFVLVQKDSRLYGRGTLDDKGAIISSLYAMKAIKDSGIPVHKKIQLILGTQEEGEWSDMDAYVKQYPLPDYGFTPDGEFPLCNIEKGCMTMCLSFPVEQISGSGLFLTEFFADSAVNTVPGSCTAKLFQYEKGKKIREEVINVEGKSTHACQPEKGENAIFLMAQKLKTYSLEEGTIWMSLKRLEEWFSDLYGEGIGLSNEKQYINGEYVDRNVFSPTRICTTDDALEVYVDIRYAYGTDDRKLIGKITSLLESCGGKVQVITNMPAVYVSKDRPFMHAFGQAYEEGSGRKNEFVLAYGGSYAKAMPNIVSWGPIFPEDEDTCHAENEYITETCLLENAVIFTAALAKITLSEKSFK